MKQNGKKVFININTTQEHLDSIGFTMEGVKKEIKFLMKSLGVKYFQVLLNLSQVNVEFNFNSQLIDRSIYISGIFRKIIDLEGFKRFLKQIDKNNSEDHLFTAKTAAWYVEQNYEVIMEPETSTGGRPDLLVVKCDNKFAVECERIDSNKFYEMDKKRKIANIAFQTIRTCDQITFELKKDLSPERIEQILNKDLVSMIYMMGAKNGPKVVYGDVYLDDNITVNDELNINIIYKPAIIGAEEDFPEITFTIISVNSESGRKLPGFAFSKGGQTVAVFGPTPDYSSIWNKKRSKSKKQAIPNLPLLVMINGDDVLGDPEIHDKYFHEAWLTAKNSQCSGVGILNFTTLDGKAKLDYFANPFADYPIEQF